LRKDGEIEEKRSFQGYSGIFRKFENLYGVLGVFNTLFSSLGSHHLR
jgi:hypothetical protein